jgi:hypothetical protein
MNRFVATFKQVSSSKFNSDKNGNMPFIGKLHAGVARGTIINGTMFKREGHNTVSPYLCQNINETYTNPSTGEEIEVVTTEIIAEVSLLEFDPLCAQLGAPILDIDSNQEGGEKPKI